MLDRRRLLAGAVAVAMTALGGPSSALGADKPTASPAPRTAASARPPGHRMVVAGVAVTLGSVAAYGLLGAGLGIGSRAEDDLVRLRDFDDAEERREVLRRGRLGNRLAIAGAITAVVAAGVGIPLIVVGRRRAVAASRRARLELGPTGFGAFVRLRI